MDWIEAVAAEARRTPAVAQAAGACAIGVTQVVTDGPEGTVTYFLQVCDGQLSFGPGEAYPEDVRFQQSWDTAVGVATGTLSSQDAFMHGRILLTGNQQQLMDNQAIFAAMSPVFDTVRQDTVYA